MNRKTPDVNDWHARYGAKAECIGSDSACPRPRDSDDMEACVGCPYLVTREPGSMHVTPHPEGEKT
jgi:hypothetical protein